MRNLLILLFCFLPLLGVADVSGTYGLKDGNTMTLYYGGADRIRMETGADQFMLVRDGKVYMVRKSGGQWTAMDMSAMGKMMQQMGFQSGQRQTDDGADVDVDEYSFRDTGRTETVAGYQGTVYESVGPRGDTSEVVLSKHEDIRSLSKGWMQFSGKMMSNIGLDTDDNLKALIEREDFNDMGGVLRVEDGMRLQSVSTANKPADFFQLPPGTQMQQMPPMGGGAPTGRSEGSASDNQSSAADFMDERQQKAREEVGSDLEREADKKIKKGVDKMMKGIFGG